MKVLMLGWELPPHNSGGLGVACYHLCKALSRKAVDIEFVVPYRAEHDVDFMRITAAHPQGVKEIQLSGIAYDSYKYILEDGTEQWADIYTQQLMYEQSVARLVEEKEFDLVHAHDWLTFRAALRVKEAKGCPLILHVHSVESDRAGGHRGNPLVHEIESTALHMADKVIAVSQHTKNCIVRDYGVPADKIDVVHNSVDHTDFIDFDTDNAYLYLSALKAQGYRIVANVGRLTVQKGLTNLLHAAREVVARVPKTIFLVVGSGDQYYELIELAAQLGIAKNVIFTGFQRGKNWRDSYKIADLFVMPSVSEPFGLTPLEAIGYGTPALVSKQSGVAEAINNCLKVDFWDVDEMANQIAAVMRSDALRDTLYVKSYDELRKLSWSQAADKVFAAYTQHTQAVAA
ncbi:MAG TPA: glycosyltransferase family 4 protein [Candidatus Saccharimonadales bacterium]|nr:glycosyltransferase family 4 protein [Candidatus Saccharimonadales bacterium]